MKPKSYRLSTRSLSALFLIASLLFWGCIAWQVGAAYAMETVWVARERIVDAEATIPLQQVSVWRGLAWGLPVFLTGGALSAALTALYAAALAYFRGETGE